MVALYKALPGMFLKEHINKPNQQVIFSKKLTGEMTRHVFQTGGRVYFHYVNQSRNQMLSDSVKFTVFEGLERVMYSGVD